MAGSYSYSQLEGLWTSAGGPAAMAPVMAAIAMAESGGNPDAYNSSGASGLWQILGAVRSGDQGRLFNAQVNAKEAVLKYQSQGLGAWTTYTSGAYRKFLRKGVKASKSILTGPADFIAEVERFIGTPYVWGGASPKGFDCSGLVEYALKQVGVKDPPRTSEEQWAWVKHITRSQLQPGDLVFYAGSDGTNSQPGHVAIYVGDGDVVQAPHTGADVDKISLQDMGPAAGYGRIPGIGGASGGGNAGSAGSDGGTAVLTSSTSGPPSWTDWLPGVKSLWSFWDDLGAVSPTAAALGDIGNTIKSFEDAITWFFIPSHWVRIFAGGFGVVLTLGGLIMMSRTGRSTSVTMAGEVPVVIPGGQIAPAMAIGEITVGAILLFVAFHNLPGSVTDFGSFMSFLQGELQNQGRKTS